VKPHIIKQYVIKYFIFIVAAGLIIFVLEKLIERKKPAKEVKKSDQSAEYEIPDFTNRLNLPEINLPHVSNLIGQNSRDTLDFTVEESEMLSNFKIFVRGHEKAPILIPNALSFNVYDEGDVNADGIRDIGLICGYSTSACRTYDVITFRDKKWTTLFSVSSHLPDREKGIDYVKREGNRVRILQADGSCCQCFGLDTTYIDLIK
jgi:hypothetical protein